MRSIVHGFEELVNCGEEGLGVVGVGMDEAGVVGRACSVEGIFVLLDVVFVCKGMYCESGFLGESFQLAFTGFHEAEFGGVPWGSVGEGDGSGFEGGKLVEAGGQCAVVDVDQVHGGGAGKGGEGR